MNAIPGIGQIVKPIFADSEAASLIRQFTAKHGRQPGVNVRTVRLSELIRAVQWMPEKVDGAFFRKNDFIVALVPLVLVGDVSVVRRMIKQIGVPRLEDLLFHRFSKPICLIEVLCDAEIVVTIKLLDEVYR